MGDVDMCNTGKSTQGTQPLTHTQGENLKQKNSTSIQDISPQKVLTSLQCNLQNFSSVLRLLEVRVSTMKKKSPQALKSCYRVCQG